jgi:hypothetical protein
MLECADTLCKLLLSRIITLIWVITGSLIVRHTVLSTDSNQTGLNGSTTPSMLAHSQRFFRLTLTFG